MHLVQRVYGSMIVAAPDAAAARAVVDRAEATMGETDRCVFCAVMFQVPAAIACRTSATWTGPATTSPPPTGRRAAGRATPGREPCSRHARIVLRAEGRVEEAMATLAEAAEVFRRTGQPLDVARCEATPPRLSSRGAG